MVVSWKWVAQEAEVSGAAPTSVGSARPPRAEGLVARSQKLGWAFAQ